MRSRNLICTKEHRNFELTYLNIPSPIQYYNVKLAELLEVKEPIKQRSPSDRSPHIPTTDRLTDQLDIKNILELNKGKDAPEGDSNNKTETHEVYKNEKPIVKSCKPKIYDSITDFY